MNSFRVQFCDDGHQCAILADHIVQLCDLEQPQAGRDFNVDLGPRLRYAAFSNDGRWLAASASERTGVWDLQAPSSGAAQAEASRVGCRLFFSGQGELFSSAENECQRWKIMPAQDAFRSPKLEQLLLFETGGFRSLCLASNSLVLTGTNGIGLVETSSAESEPAKWIIGSNVVSGASSDGRWLGVFQPYTANLRVYQLPDLKLAATLQAHNNIAEFQFSVARHELAISTPKGVELWSTDDWTLKKILTHFISLLYAADGRSFWLAQSYRSAGLYDADSLRLLLPLPEASMPLAASADGHYLATSVDARRLQLWDLFEVRSQLRALKLDW